VDNTQIAESNFLVLCDRVVLVTAHTNKILLGFVGDVSATRVAVDVYFFRYWLGMWITKGSAKKLINSLLE
jgi:hypothetical protein